jgi:hypothetical protein
MLVIDEGHHLYEGSKTHQAFQPLYDLAKLVVIITGLIERSDRKRIAFLPYESTLDGELQVQSRSTLETRWISYDLHAALTEQVIIPTYFVHLEGETKYIDRNGDHQHKKELADDHDALFTAITTQMAEALMRRGALEWNGYRQIYRRAKLLVVCARQKQARKCADFLQQVLQIRAGVAVSDDGKAADAMIDTFRNGDIDCLVTVAKAYEGMDVPEITHLVCLTHIRAYGWLYQMLARAWRVDYKAIKLGIPYESQQAKVYVPNDDMMSEVIRTIEAIRDKAMADSGRTTPTLPPAPQEPPGNVVPLSSIETDFRGTQILGEELLPDETRYFHDMLVAEGLLGLVTEVQMKRIWQRGKTSNAATGSPSTTMAEEPIVTPREEEDRIKTRANDYLLAYEREHGLTFGATNLVLRKEGWPKREDLRGQKVLALWKHIQRRFPREGQV